MDSFTLQQTNLIVCLKKEEHPLYVIKTGEGKYRFLNLETTSLVTKKDRRHFIAISPPMLNAPGDVFRFSIAHELGHLKLGHLEGDGQCKRILTEELEADKFAAKLCGKQIAINVLHWFIRESIMLCNINSTLEFNQRLLAIKETKIEKKNTSFLIKTIDSSH